MKKYEYKCVSIWGFGEKLPESLTNMEGKAGSLYAHGEYGIILKKS